MKIQLIIIMLFVSTFSFAHNSTNFQQAAQASLNFPKDTNHLNDAKILTQLDASLDSFRLTPMVGVNLVANNYNVIAYYSNQGTDPINDTIWFTHGVNNVLVYHEFSIVNLSPNQADSFLFSQQTSGIIGMFLASVVLSLTNDSDSTNDSLSHGYSIGIGFSNPNSNSLSIFPPQPNPANDQVNIPFSVISESDMEFTLLNTEGRIIYQKQSHYIPGSHQLEFNVSACAEGIYFYSFKIGSETKGGKLMVKH